MRSFCNPTRILKILGKIRICSKFCIKLSAGDIGNPRKSQLITSGITVQAIWSWCSRCYRRYPQLRLFCIRIGSISLNIRSSKNSMTSGVHGSSFCLPNSPRPTSIILFYSLINISIYKGSVFSGNKESYPSRNLFGTW